MAFKKGQITNPTGRPKGVPNRRTALLNAIKYVEGRTDPETGKKRKKLLVHALEQAYKDNTVLVAILKKIIPDLKAVEVTGKDGSGLKTTIQIELVGSAKKQIESDKDIKTINYG
jgi:hypothetical protein